jgi:hypothetical protein
MKRETAEELVEAVGSAICHVYGYLGYASRPIGDAVVSAIKDDNHRLINALLRAFPEAKESVITKPAIIENSPKAQDPRRANLPPQTLPDFSQESMAAEPTDEEKNRLIARKIDPCFTLKWLWTTELDAENCKIHYVPVNLADPAHTLRLYCAMQSGPSWTSCNKFGIRYFQLFASVIDDRRISAKDKTLRIRDLAYEMLREEAK